MASNFDAFHFRLQSYEKNLIYANGQTKFCSISRKKLYFSPKASKRTNLALKMRRSLYAIQPIGVAAWARDNVGKGGGLVGVETESGGGEILISSGLDTEDAITQFDDVEINLQDALLTPQEFDEHGEVRLKEFARVST